MKFKKYKTRDHLSQLIVFWGFELLMIVTTVFCVFVYSQHLERVEDGIAYVLTILMLVFTVAGYAKGMFFRVMGTLTVADDMVTWSCPFYKSVSLHIEECLCVGVVPLEWPPNGIYQKFSDRSGWAFIYLSKNPIAEKTKQKKITAKHPQKGFIWFFYTDELCLHLIEILPVEKSRALEGFYNQLQDKKRLREREEAARKRRLEKEKEKQRKKK